MSDISYSPFKFILVSPDGPYFVSELSFVVLILYLVLAGPPVGLGRLLLCLDWHYA
jgi:hypothetical protein